MRMLKNRLKVVRTARNVSQEALATELGVKKGTISKYETGRVPMNEARINQIAQILRCSPAELLDLSDSSSPAPVLAPKIAIDPLAYPFDLPLRVLRAIVADGGSKTLEGYQLSEDSAEFRRRPPGVANASGAYCTYVPTDALYRYERGDMIVVNPDRIAKIGDPVLLTVRNPGSDVEITYIGRLLKADRQWTVLEVDRPARATDQFSATTIESCHKILSTEELLGF